MSLLGPKVSVQLQELSTSTGNALDVVETWTTVAAFKGCFQPVSRDERQANNMDTAFGRYILLVAYGDLTSNIRAKLIEPNRVIIADDNYNIIGVEPYHNHHFEIYLRIIDAE